MNENKDQASASDEPNKIKFDKEDFDSMALVLDTHPELKICTLAVKESRKQKVKYPLTEIGQVQALLGKNKMLAMEGHHLSMDTIKKYLIKEDFPIQNEADLIARVHVALWRCKEDIVWSKRAPQDAESILKSITTKP